MFRTALVLILALVPVAAFAQDGGTGDGGPGCGNVTFEGECQGNVLVYCDPDSNSVVMVDCGVDVDPTAMCTQIDPSYGFDCALGVGEGCVDDEGAIYLCLGTDPGCFEDPTGAVCTESVGPCVEADVDTCNGEQWIFECTVNQPYIVDCNAYGGRCGTRPGRCFDIQVGGFCGDGFECADGLTCGALGLCEGTPPQPDAGVSVRDAGTTAPRDGGAMLLPPPKRKVEEDGCSCNATARAGTPWALGALVLMFAFRKRH